jgi:hypothetical protein
MLVQACWFLVLYIDPPLFSARLALPLFIA